MENAGSGAGGRALDGGPIHLTPRVWQTASIFARSALPGTSHATCRRASVSVFAARPSLTHRERGELYMGVVLVAVCFISSVGAGGTDRVPVLLRADQ